MNSQSCCNRFCKWLFDTAAIVQLLLNQRLEVAQIAIHVLGVVRPSIKIIAPTQQSLRLSLM